MRLAPIAIFAFNRPQHLKKTLDALAANSLAEESDVVIFCDAPRNAEEAALTDSVRTIAREASGFRSVRTVERERNLGCAQAVISGLAEMFALHERLVVIEDDILCSRHTLSFLNTCLEKYATEPTVFSIAAWAPPPGMFRVPAQYPYDVYFTPRFHCWGWASWRERWEKIDWKVADYPEFKRQRCLRQAFSQGGKDLVPMLEEQMEGRLDTWDIQLDYSRFKHGCLGLNPVHSYTTNIGMGCGTHTKEATTVFDNNLELALPSPRLPDYVFMDSGIVAKRRQLCERPVWRKIIDKIRRIIF